MISTRIRRRLAIWMLPTIVSTNAWGVEPIIAETISEATAVSDDVDAEASPLPAKHFSGARSTSNGKTNSAGNGPKRRQDSDHTAIRITGRRAPLPPLDAVLQALQQGEPDKARQIYADMLRNDSQDINALTGLALIHLQQGNHAAAETLLAKALTLEPRSPQAQALWATLHDRDTSSQTESKINQLLAEQPNAAPLHFALGNIRAHQGRWREAQQAYFDATIADQGNPDYLFNLAVSLEHIRQTQIAKQYYKAALTAAERRPAAFNRVAATSRIEALEQVTQ